MIQILLCYKFCNSKINLKWFSNNPIVNDSKLWLKITYSFLALQFNFFENTKQDTWMKEKQGRQIVHRSGALDLAELV